MKAEAWATRCTAASPNTVFGAGTEGREYSISPSWHTEVGTFWHDIPLVTGCTVSAPSYATRAQTGPGANFRNKVLEAKSSRTAANYWAGRRSSKAIGNGNTTRMNSRSISTSTMEITGSCIGRIGQQIKERRKPHEHR